MTKQSTQKETAKGDKFSEQIPTSIWYEEESAESPYIAGKQYLYGYDFEQTVDQLSYSSLLFLMLTGELISRTKEPILTLLMKILITTGPRHPACRAAMNAGIGRTDVTHILPIALNVHSGEYLGSKEVGSCMRWLATNRVLIPEKVECCLPTNEAPNPIPGFGLIYGGKDIITNNWVDKFQKFEQFLPSMLWMKKVLKHLNSNGNTISWLPTGFAATLFYDLGISHRHATALYQFLSSPGFIAHGVEKANKPLTDMPFIPESNYEIKS